MFAAILFEESQESKFARSTMVLISLMPDSGTGTSGQMVTPGPVRLMRRLQHLTKSSTYAESPRSDKWLKDPTRITLPCGSAPYGLICSLNTSLKMPSMSPNIPSSTLITNMQVSPLPAGTKGEKLWQMYHDILHTNIGRSTMYFIITKVVDADWGDVLECRTYHLAARMI